MFDAVLNRHTRSPRRWGRGVAVTLALHIAALAGVAYASFKAAHNAETTAPEVTFFAASPPPPPPPPAPAGGGAAKSTPKVQPKIQKKPDTIVESKKKEPQPEPEPPKEQPKEAPSPGGKEGGQTGGVNGGQVGGQVGGQIGGNVDGQLGGQPGGTNAVLPFGAGMERPRMIAGSREVVWTREAKAANASGTAILKCVITVDGSVTSCRIIKGVPFMDQAILAMVAGWKYTPVVFQGRPVAVEYTFTIPLRSAP